MGDLHSIAYSYRSGCSHHSSSLGWDFHNLGVFNADMSHFMDSSSSSTPPFLSTLDSDLSTGYLEDALFEFSSKRRRLLFFSDTDQTKDSTDPIKSWWNCNRLENYPEDFGYLSQINRIDTIPGKPMNSVSGIIQDATIFTGMKTIAEEEAVSPYQAFDSSPSSQSKDSVSTQSISNKETLYPMEPISFSEGGEKRKKKRVITRVVYPFAMVKPGGIEGDVTLNDINERILKPPTRPVKHPVGDFACRPMVSPEGPGLSGKAVVALTKIQTQGSGTITIIRTKG